MWGMVQGTGKKGTRYREKGKTTGAREHGIQSGGQGAGIGDIRVGARRQKGRGEQAVNDRG